MVLANGGERAPVIETPLDRASRQVELLCNLELNATQRDVRLTNEEALAKDALVGRADLFAASVFERKHGLDGCCGRPRRRGHRSPPALAAHVGAPTLLGNLARREDT